MTTAHICERQSGFAVPGHPDDLGFATQLVLVARQSEFELNDLASDQRSEAFERNPGLADVAGLRDESPVARVDQSRFCAQAMRK